MLEIKLVVYRFACCVLVERARNVITAHTLSKRLHNVLSVLRTKKENETHFMRKSVLRGVISFTKVSHPHGNSVMRYFHFV